MTPESYNPQEYDIYIGNDVDKKSFALTVRERYRTLMNKRIPADPQQLYNFARNRFPGKRVIVGYEAGPTGFGLYDYLIKRAVPCVLISPASLLRPANQRVKTNRIDSERLADMLSDGHFEPVRVPDGPYRELRHLVQVRTNYAKLQRTSKQRIKALLLLTGLDHGLKDADTHWSNVYIQALHALDCTPAVRFQLDRLLDDLKYARKQLSLSTKQLRRFCQETPEINEHIQHLTTIPGIGMITASVVLGRIGDPKQLKGLREISMFCGLVPRENSTGDTQRRGSITHLGDPYLRSLLVEAAWGAIRKDKELEQFFHRIAGRHHARFARQKAIVAVAHKLTHRIYCVLTERRAYTVR